MNALKMAKVCFTLHQTGKISPNLVALNLKGHKIVLCLNLLMGKMSKR